MSQMNKLSENKINMKEMSTYSRCPVVHQENNSQINAMYLKKSQNKYAD